MFLRDRDRLCLTLSSCCCKPMEVSTSDHHHQWELCHPLELSGVLLSILWIQTIICFCLNSCLQLNFALAVRSGMGCCNGCLLYLDIFYSFSWSYTPNIEWFCDLPGISITAERFFQYSETINYQTTNIFASNKYHLEREEKKFGRLLSSVEETLLCNGRR